MLNQQASLGPQFLGQAALQQPGAKTAMRRRPFQGWPTLLSPPELQPIANGIWLEPAPRAPRISCPGAEHRQASSHRRDRQAAEPELHCAWGDVAGVPLPRPGKGTVRGIGGGHKHRNREDLRVQGPWRRGICLQEWHTKMAGAAGALGHPSGRQVRSNILGAVQGGGSRQTAAHGIPVHRWGRWLDVWPASQAQAVGVDGNLGSAGRGTLRTAPQRPLAMQSQPATGSAHGRVTCPPRPLRGWSDPRSTVARLKLRTKPGLRR